MVDEEDSKTAKHIHKVHTMTGLEKRFESQTVIKEANDSKIKHCTSELMPLDWEELKDDDLIEVSHWTNGIKSGSSEKIYESRCISFKDLCHAIKVNLMVNGAIPFQGED